MKKLCIYIIFSFTAILSGSSEKQANQANFSVPDLEVEINNSGLKELNGVYYYDGKLFSGFLVSYYPDDTQKEKSGYVNGKLSGFSNTWFQSGMHETERYYKNGEKDSTHTGWYDNGNKRFEFTFKNGLNDGMSKQWYKSEALFSQVTYAMGKETEAKQWLENGKLFTNYVVRDNVIYGLNNSNLCYTIKNERGEYVKTK